MRLTRAKSEVVIQLCPPRTNQRDAGLLPLKKYPNIKKTQDKMISA